MKQSGAKIIVDCLLEQGVEYVFGYPGSAIMDVFDELYKQSEEEKLTKTKNTNLKVNDMKQSGAKIIVDCLTEQGVEYVFGYPGGYIIDTFDELYKAKDRIKQILTCHEQGAAHAADGYARATGKVGVCMSTSGPGATNLVTGIATAYMDSVPLIAITGNVALNFLGRDSFQEVDIAGVTMPITKHNYIVKDVTELADTIREAFKIAVSGRPGPVLIDVPKNIQQMMCEYEPKPVEKTERKSYVSDTEEAVKILNECSRPLLYVGGGCIISGAEDELKEFADKLGAPVACSMMGLGAFPASDKKYLGMIGMHGHAAVAKAMRECDVIVTLGARFSDRVAGDRNNFCRHAKIVQIDIDMAEINKNVKVTASVMGDVKNALKIINQKITNKPNEEWLKYTEKLVKDNPLKYSDQKLNPRRILETLNKIADKDQIIVTDVGQHQMWTAQTYRFDKPRTFLTSGGLGTMGFGMGAAIGAAFGTKSHPVLITGDGSFHMNMAEIVTAVKNNLPLTVLIFDNNTLGMVRQWQTLFYGERYSSTTLNMPTDYVKLAEALGAKGMILDDDNDIEKVLKTALKTPSTVIVDCRIYSNEFVLPMIPPGKSVDDLITDIDPK